MDLDYKFCSAIMTDTKATMCKAGHLFVHASRQCGGSTQWHGCVDHILELITGIAMKDYEGSEGTMAAARSLVGHFSQFTSRTEAIKFANNITTSIMHPRCGHTLVVHLLHV